MRLPDEPGPSRGVRGTDVEEKPSTAAKRSSRLAALINETRPAPNSDRGHLQASRHGRKKNAYRHSPVGIPRQWLQWRRRWVQHPITTCDARRRSRSNGLILLSASPRETPRQPARACSPGPNTVPGRELIAAGRWYHRPQYARGVLAKSVTKPAGTTNEGRLQHPILRILSNNRILAVAEGRHWNRCYWLLSSGPVRQKEAEKQS